MTTPKKDADGAPSLADLFDLPADAQISVWSEPEDAPDPRAFGERARPSPHDATAAAAATRGADDEAVSGAAPGNRPLSWLWIALGGLAAVNVVILAIPFSFRDAPVAHEEDSAIPVLPAAAAALDETTGTHAVTPTATPTVTHAVAPRAPAVPTDHSALVAARAALRAAEADLTAGRHAGARARLGRLLLAIDAVEPRERDGIHAAAALLVARSLQADAEAARSSQADVDLTRRASR